jgi:hypothetical protein
MEVAVYVPLLVPALAALAARPLAARLPPPVAAWLLTATAVALAIGSTVALGVLALSAVLRIGFVEGVGGLSGAVLNRGDAISVPVAVIAGGLLAVAAGAVGLALWRRVLAITAAHRHASTLPGTGQVVVTEDTAADAYTLPGWPCRVVVTRGMLDALAARERAVLLAHERAHAANSHYLFTSAARLAAAANPLLRPVADEIGYAVERWADECAAAETADRALTARAIARAALATSAAPPARVPALPSLGIARGAGPVPRRVAAMLVPPPRTAPLLLAAPVVLVAVSAVAALAAGLDLHQLIELAQIQPH